MPGCQIGEHGDLNDTTFEIEWCYVAFEPQAEKIQRQRFKIRGLSFESDRRGLVIERQCLEIET
jgi:hypothetical protein